MSSRLSLKIGCSYAFKMLSSHGGGYLAIGISKEGIYPLFLLIGKHSPHQTTKELLIILRMWEKKKEILKGK